MGSRWSDDGYVYFMGSIFTLPSIFRMARWRRQSSPEPKDRADLSDVEDDWRHARGLVIGVGTRSFAYETVNGNTVLSGPRMTIIAGVFSVLAIVCYLLCFQLVRERVEVPANNKKLDISQLLRVWSQTVRCLGLSPQRSRCCLRRSRCRACPGMFSRIIMAMRRRSLRPRSREVSRYCLSVRRLRQNYQRNMEKGTFCDFLSGGSGSLSGFVSSCILKMRLCMSHFYTCICGIWFLTQSYGR